MQTTIFTRFKKNILSIVTSLAFFIGSMLFLPNFSEHATIGVWLFMTGSALMFIDTLRSRNE